MHMIVFRIFKAGLAGIRRNILCAIALLAAFGLIGEAAAQIRLPPVHLPVSPIGGLPDISSPLRNAELSVEARRLVSLRINRQRELARQYGDVLELDPAGALVLRGQLLAIAPSAEALAAIAAAGFRVVGERELAGLDIKVLILQPPPGLALAMALSRLRTLDPAGSYDYNHVYSDSGDVASAKNGTAANSQAIGHSPSPAPSPAPGSMIKLGLIDSGVDRAHPSLREASIQSWGCAGNRIGSAHGTAVASLMAGSVGKFHGVAPGATIYAADVYCGAPTGGAVDAIVDALAWMARERVAVINLSLVGPPNLTLERVLKVVSARGHIVVAAVGNDGPASPPLYPAAYAEVVAVTGVDARERVLPEACRGPHVAFAAPGNNMLAADNAGNLVEVRGTSFAAPIVAALLARSLPVPDRASADKALAALAQSAIDLGARGRDPVYGYGLVGMEYRNAP